MSSGKYGSRWFNALNIIFLFLLSVATLYPFWDSFVVSITPLEESLSTNLHLYPKTITWEAYRRILAIDQLWLSYRVSIVVTLLGTLISTGATLLAAYALSKKALPGGRLIMFAIVFTMMFSGGVIPAYLVVKQLGIMNSIWAMILPGAIHTYNLILMRNFFDAFPEELEESARLDGCGDIAILIRIVLPLSLPGIATISLFYAVAQWNEFFTAVMYVVDKTLWPLQLFLRAMLMENDAAMQYGDDNLFLMGKAIKMAAVMISVIPVMLIYPFFQKYFVQGATLGAVKE